jgi:tetratricopeptide (TPR) repeat protein
MAPKVAWLGRAEDKIERRLLPMLTTEIRRVFPQAQAVTVYDCFGGYSQNHDEKIVLGVEVRSSDSYHTHVLKLGSRQKAARDYEGWRKCVLQHNFASRILVSLVKKDLPRGRVAIVYEDAYRFFGSPEEGDQGPLNLEAAAFLAVLDNKPHPASVERVICQIYTDLYRWFYRTATASERQAKRFFLARLRRGFEKWRTERWRRDLRRDLIWLLCGRDPVGATHFLRYLDPYDYVGWALCHGSFPQTLVGRSHGDLHGRNVFVGVQRGEAEYPAVFDYGEMDDTNVIVWDFVKLETEIKVRLLLPLYQDAECRKTLLELGAREHPLTSVAYLAGPSATRDVRTLRLEQLAFAFHFEDLLAKLTGRIHQLANPDLPEPPGGRVITGNANLDRAAGLLLRVRQEAALYLGDLQPQRGRRRNWRDEYYFALTAYGLCSAKFDYTTSESAFALVSAGVAAAQTEMARHDVCALAAAKPSPGPRRATPHPYPSYLVPLAQAHRLWKASHRPADSRRALEIVERAARRYDYAVPLLQEYALLLAETHCAERAMRLLEPLEDLGRVFRDEETLCRIGRTCKDLGDRALEGSPVPLKDLAGHPAWQWYRTAFAHYSEAFERSNGYYPGINAATLALLCGQHEQSRHLAERTLAICGGTDLSLLRREDRFWILVTQGEALLLLRDSGKAADFYSHALRALSPGERGIAQSSYNQVCRLVWALGPVVAPVVRAFRAAGFRLRRGPLCNGRAA